MSDELARRIDELERANIEQQSVNSTLHMIVDGLARSLNLVVGKMNKSETDQAAINIKLAKALEGLATTSHQMLEILAGIDKNA